MLGVKLLLFDMSRKNEYLGGTENYKCPLPIKLWQCLTALSV